jgi:hypothetical protein
MRRTVIPLLDRLNCTYVDSGVYAEGAFAGLPSLRRVNILSRLRHKLCMHKSPLVGHFSGLIPNLGQMNEEDSRYVSFGIPGPESPGAA